MERRRSRLAFLGVLALALTVTVGLLGGGAEAAKKKKGKKKKGGNLVTVTNSTPTPIPFEDAVTGVNGLATMSLNVGKVAKGKVVSWASVSVTTSFSGGAGFGDQVSARLTAPNGRTATLINPVPNNTVANNETSSGPLTETPNSPFGTCTPDPAPPPPPCADPLNTLGPPYIGTVGNGGLDTFGGIPARGTWLIRVLNSSTTIPATLNSAKLDISLKTNPQ